MKLEKMEGAFTAPIILICMVTMVIGLMFYGTVATKIVDIDTVFVPRATKITSLLEC